MDILNGYLCGVACAVKDGIVYRHTCTSDGMRRSDAAYGMPDDATARELLRAFQLEPSACDTIFEDDVARDAFRRFAAGFSAEELRGVLASLESAAASRDRGMDVAGAFATSVKYLKECVDGSCAPVPLGVERDKGGLGPTQSNCRYMPNTPSYSGGTLYRAEGGVVYRCEDSGYGTGFKETPWYAFPEPSIARRWLELYLDAVYKDLGDLFGEFQWEFSIQELHDIAAGCFTLARQTTDAPKLRAAYREGGKLFSNLFWDKWWEDSWPDNDECYVEGKKWDRGEGWDELTMEGGDRVGMPCVRTYGV